VWAVTLPGHLQQLVNRTSNRRQSAARVYDRRSDRVDKGTPRSGPATAALAVASRSPSDPRFPTFVSRSRRFDLRDRLTNSVEKIGGLEPRANRLHDNSTLRIGARTPSQNILTPQLRGKKCLLGRSAGFSPSSVCHSDSANFAPCVDKCKHNSRWRSQSGRRTLRNPPNSQLPSVRPADLTHDFNGIYAAGPGVSQSHQTVLNSSAKIRQTGERRKLKVR
jgi:hypothetical protein